MLMILAALAIHPLSVPLDEVAISAEICPNNSMNSWEVTVFITQPPDQEQDDLIQGNQIEAQLIAESGATLTILEHPSGSLATTGGGLGTATSAPFQFQQSEDTPKQLVVTYQGQTAQFNIVPAEENDARCN